MSATLTVPQTLEPIREIAGELGIPDAFIEPYGSTRPSCASSC